MSYWLQHPDLTFDPEEHKYLWKGSERPSVSQVLESVGILNRKNGFYNPIGYGHFAKQDINIANFGSAFHKIAPAIVLNQNVSYPETMEPWVANLKKWLSKNNLRPIKDKNGIYIIEYPMYSVRLGFCGMPDMYALNKKDDVCGIDWKTSQKLEKHYRYQTAGYDILTEEVHGFKTKHRIAVRITDTDIEDEVRTNKPEDRIMFQSCLNVLKMAA